MMGRLKLLYPFLFAVLPILTVLTRNPGGSRIGDIATVIASMLVACSVVYAVVAFLTRQRWTSPVVPLIVLALVLWFYSYDALRSLHRIARGTPAPLILTAAAVMALATATVVVVWWLARRPQYLDRVTTFFALTGLLLVAWSVFRIGADQLAARKALRESRLAARLTAPISKTGQALSGGGRDIYLLILDEYANAGVLREHFEFDNRQFEDSLRQLGFTIPRLVQSNYVHTLLSIPSLLNFSHLTEVGDEVGSRNTDPTLPNYLVENNRTVAFLKSRGYDFLFFPSQWWISTSHNRNADWEFRAWTGFNPVRELSRSDLRRAFIGTTPLAQLRKHDAYDADHVKRTLDAMAQVPLRQEPTFALAHILNPHYPYVFDARCRILKTRSTAGWEQGRQRAYTDQVRCLNTLLLRTVSTIIQQSSPAPIILLVGDHGTNSLRYSQSESAEAVSPAQARERFGAFGAFFLPGGGAGHLADSVTLVNVVPTVLNYYFDAGIPLAPDKLYMSLEQTPYLFAEVDPASLAGR